MADKPVIVITGAPVWLKAVTAQLEEAYVVTLYRERSGYITHLADDHAALIIVDGSDQHWRYWTVTPKTNPATRRIPVILVMDDTALHTNGLLAGADVVLSQTEFLTQLPTLVSDYARISNADYVAQIACDCDSELPELARQGVEMFNQHEFYKQHDLLEALWVQTKSPVRDLYRAILQVGIAYYQIMRGNHRGATKMLLRSLQWFAVLPDVCQGIDVAQLREDAQRVRSELERTGENGLAEFDLTLLKPVLYREM